MNKCCVCCGTTKDLFFTIGDWYCYSCTYNVTKEELNRIFLTKKQGFVFR